MHGHRLDSATIIVFLLFTSVLGLSAHRPELPGGTTAAGDSKQALPASATPTAVQTAWQERQLGGLITWGMNVPLANSSSKPRPGNHFKTTGVSMCSGCNWQLDSLPPLSEFEPTDLDIPQWVKAARSFGARYLILAAYHAGGFALWPTNATVPGHGRYAYSTAFSTGSWVQQHGRDIVAMFVSECRRQGILPGFYVIMGENMFLNIGAEKNSHSVDPSGRFNKCTISLPGQLNITRDAYFAVALEMLGELLSNYGPIYEVWFDGGVPPELAEDIGVLVDSHAPDAVSFQGPSRHSAGLSGNVVRWSGTETGHTPAADMWSTIKPGAQDVQTMAYGAGTKPGTEPDLEYVPAEQDGAIQSGTNAGGFWYPGESPKTIAELIAEYEDSVGHNANYLLELSPDPQGRIPAADVATYQSFGQALERCYGPQAVQMELLNESGTIFELAGASVAVDRLLIEEDVVRCGQLVTNYSLTIGEKVLDTGGSIGHCRIHRLPAPVPARTKISLKILQSLASTGHCAQPRLRRMASFDHASCMGS